MVGVTVLVVVLPALPHASTRSRGSELARLRGELGRLKRPLLGPGTSARGLRLLAVCGGVGGGERVRGGCVSVCACM